MFGQIPTLNLLSIDPGFTNLGICVSTLDYTNQTMHVHGVDTVPISKLVAKSPLTDYLNTSIIASQIVTDVVTDFCMRYDIDVVIVESAYLNRFPQAYASLTMCLNAIGVAIGHYDIDIGFYTLDPATIKVANGVSGGSSNKDDMSASIIKNKNIVLPSLTNSLDEHSWDAIGIGYAYLYYSM